MLTRHQFCWIPPLLLLYACCTLSFAMATAATADDAVDAAAPAAKHYVIAYAPALADAADAWAEYREADGWSVHLLPVDRMNDADRDPKPDVLRQRIREVYHAAGKPATERFAVLLLGDAPDPNADDAEQPWALPTWVYEQADPDLRDRRDSTFITDQPHQYMDDDDNDADILLGRIPARTSDAAMTVLEKICRYEQSPAPGRWRMRVAFTAGEGRFGQMDRILEHLFRQMVDRYVPAEYDVSMAYAHPLSPFCPPPDQLTETVLEQMSSGCLLFNYIGHGNQRNFDYLLWNGKRLNILHVHDLVRLDELTPDAEGSTSAIALLTCCSAGWFDIPGGRQSLAEALLFHPAGPVAVIAGSRQTHPYANAILQKEISRHLLTSRAPTVGLLDHRTLADLVEIDEEDQQLDALASIIAISMQWKTTLAELRTMHTLLYNLLGDPATAIPEPIQPIENVHLTDDGLLTVELPQGIDGTVTVTIERSRGDLSNVDLVAVENRNDPDLLEKARANYVAATTSVIHSFDISLDQARTGVDLRTYLERAPDAALVRVYLRGRGDQGDQLHQLRVLPAPATTGRRDRE